MLFEQKWAYSLWQYFVWSGVTIFVLELNSKLVYSAYRDRLTYSNDPGFSNKFQLFLDETNFSHVWVNQVTFSKARLLNAVMLKLKDSYIRFWRKYLFDDSKNAIYGNKLRTYRTLKTAYCLDNYLLSSNNSRKEISTYTKTRINCNKLHVEEGRYRKIPLQERICQLWHCEVQDAKHFVLACSKLGYVREHYFENINTICSTFNSMNDLDKFQYIMTSKDYDLNILWVSLCFELHSKRNLLATLLDAIKPRASGAVMVTCVHLYLKAKIFDVKMTNDKGIAKKSEFPIMGHMQPIDQSARKKKVKMADNSMASWNKDKYIDPTISTTLFFKFNSSLQPNNELR